MQIGEMKHGPRNLITDVPGVKVGHCTVDRGENHTGVTVVIPCPEKWCGVTYKEDRESMKAELQSKKDKGLYPEKLWK